MSGSRGLNKWLGTIFLSQSSFQMPYHLGAGTEFRSRAAYVLIEMPLALKASFWKTRVCSSN